MADLKVRQLDDLVAKALEARAARRGVSLEEEVRATLAAAVATRYDAFRRRADAIRATTAAQRGKVTDSARLIRQERDGTG